MDFADESELIALLDLINDLRKDHSVHVGIEESFIHPLLSERVPGGAKKLEEEHKDQERRLNELASCLENIQSKTVDFEKRKGMALEFYGALNRYISLYLSHIDEEEEKIQPALWALCTNQELGNVFKNAVTSLKPDEAGLIIKITIPALNMEERIEFISGALKILPPSASQSTLDLIPSILPPKDRTALKSKLAI